jgi:hypothetical protein
MRDRLPITLVLAALTALAMAVVAAPAGATTPSSAQDEYTLDNPGAGGGGSLGGKNGGGTAGAGGTGTASSGGGKSANATGTGKGAHGKGNSDIKTPASTTRGVDEIAADSSSNTGIVLLLIALVAIAGAGAVFIVRRRRAATRTD